MSSARELSWPPPSPACPGRELLFPHQSRIFFDMQQQVEIAALKAGDEKAFRTLVEQFQDRVYRTCFGILGNRDQAEDAAQETFIEVFSAITTFRGEAQLATWIYRIAVVTALKAIRKKRRKKWRALLFTDDNEYNNIVSARDPDDGNHPLLQLENKERAEILYKAMDRLPESQRTAFTLHKIEGLEYKKIAEVMDLSLSSVESLIHRAKLNLQKYLGQYYRGQA